MVHDGIRTYEPQRPTCLCTDWSNKRRTDLHCLLQKHCRCSMAQAPYCCKDGWNLVFAGSRFTTPAESRYTPVESEALAVSFGLEKCRMFMIGCNDFIVATDHKPLVKILGDGNFDTIANPRLFRIKERTLRYDYTINHESGASHHAPDAFSRRRKSRPLTVSCLTTEVTDEELQQSSTISTLAEACACSAIDTMYDHHNTAKAVTIQCIQATSGIDQDYKDLLKLCQDGSFKRCKSAKQHIEAILESSSRLVCYKRSDYRLLIQSSLRREVLEILHAAHQGVVGMRARAATCALARHLRRYLKPSITMQDMQHHHIVTAKTPTAFTSNPSVPLQTGRSRLLHLT